MNQMRFRELLKSARDSVAMTSAEYHGTIHNPCFQYGVRESISDQEMQWCMENLMDQESEVGEMPNRLPFDVFSVWFSNTTVPCDPPDDTLKILGMVVSGIHREFERKDKPGVTFKSKLMILTFLEIDGRSCWMRCNYSGKKKEGLYMNSWRDGKPFDIWENESNTKALQDMANLSRTYLIWLLFDINNPNSTVLRVTPEHKAGGRSAEWVLARTHYLILNQKQAQALRDSKKTPSAHDIKRAAHWRRAHLRRLSSDKFRHKKGSLVFVKQSWVGPGEWIGLDGKTYKVINPQKPTDPSQN
jgi:hypothetical protein